MELSELIWWAGKYLTVCDYTGLVYKIRPRQGDVFPRFVLADGDGVFVFYRQLGLILPLPAGKQLKTLKAEWMAVQDSSLLIGGHGKEWVKVFRRAPCTCSDEVSVPGRSNHCAGLRVGQSD